MFDASGRFQVVEREQLVLALEELHIGASALADEKTRLQIGRIIGARFMVFGGYLPMAGQTRVDLRLVEVEPGRIRYAARASAPGEGLADGFAAAEAAAAGILDHTVLP